MPFRVHIVHEADPRLLMRLDAMHSAIERIEGQVTVVLKNQGVIMATLDETLQAVNDESTQEDSIVTLLQQLREQITGLTSGNLPPDVQAKVDAVFTKLQDNKAKLAAAINSGSATPNMSTPAPSKLTPASGSNATDVPAPAGTSTTGL